MKMIPIVLNEDLQRVGMLDGFKSFIWTERYQRPGDFEIVYPITADALGLVKLGRYIIRDDRSEIGIIESINLTSEFGRGDSFLRIAGRFASSILGRRIIDTVAKFSRKTPGAIIRSLIEATITAPTDAKRKIEIFMMDSGASGTAKTHAQYTGKNLLEIVEALCSENDMGFRTYIKEGKIALKLYYGTDRRATVVFSPAFDNLNSEEYRESIEERITNVLVAGEGEGTARKTAWATVDDPAGLDRYELYQDARNLRDTDETAAYLTELRQEGLESITPFTKSHMAEVSLNGLTYKQDIDVGDIITIRNDAWGITETPRILEVIESMDETGRYSITPSFAE